jgi:hypothetical protein
MSSTDEKKPPAESSTKKSSDTVKGLDISEEKESAGHDAVETAPAAKADQVAPVGFTELFR